MDKPVYITIAPENVGKTCLKAFGEVILAERLSGEMVPRDFVPEDVGRRIYLLPPYELAVESGEQQRWREAFFTISYVCDLLGCTVWGRSPTGPFSILADPYQGNASPWCDTLKHLEEVLPSEPRLLSSTHNNSVTFLTPDSRRFTGD